MSNVKCNPNRLSGLEDEECMRTNTTSPLYIHFTHFVKGRIKRPSNRKKFLNRTLRYIS